MSQVSDRLLGSGHIISLITTGSQINIFPLKIIKYIIFKFAKADKEKIMTNFCILVRSGPYLTSDCLQFTLHVCIVHLAAISKWREFDHSVEGHLYVGHLVLGHLQEVAEQAPEHGLVAHHHHVLLPLELHDDRLHPGHQVLVTLAIGISEHRKIKGP